MAYWKAIFRIFPAMTEKN